MNDDGTAIEAIPMKVTCRTKWRTINDAVDLGRSPYRRHTMTTYMLSHHNGTQLM